MRFDPRLRISDDVAYELEVTGFGPTLPSVVISSSYFAPLTCEVVDGNLFVRAATGEEVTDTLSTGVFELADSVDWPGDVPQRLGTDLTWQDQPGAPIEQGPAVRIWAGEVIFRRGFGLAGPFFVHQMAAAAWACSTALGQSEEEVFESQVVHYACVRLFAPRLLLCGDKQARRLGRFDVSPLRPWGVPLALDLPRQHKQR